MADNITVTPGTGALIAADELSIDGALALVQRVKLVTGVPGTGTDVSASSPLPTVAVQATVTETKVAMTGLWVKVWTAATAKRIVIGLPSDSAASGDYSFNAALSGLSTSGGIPFAAGAGGSFDFAGGAIPNSDLYVKATNGSSVTVQVFN